MTDHPEPGRIDLRVLDDPRGPDQAGRVIRAALARAGLEARVVSWLAGRFRPLAAVAAGLLLVGLGLLRLAPLPGDPSEPTARWIAAQHIPSNGELLGEFRRYRP